MNRILISRSEAFRNSLLAGLPAAEFDRIQPALRPVFLKLGDVLHECCNEMDAVYFPTTAVITLLHLTQDGTTTTTGIVGNDGILGIELFMGGNSAPNLAIVHSAGQAFRMSAKAVKSEFAANSAFRDSLLRYTQALLTQVSQTAVCNRLHSVQQQLARWLLDSLDRLEADKLELTHEQVARFLGVRRESVTLAIEKLSKLGLITNVRGLITIIDRGGLEFAACECYRVVSDEYDRLVGRKYFPNSRSVAVGLAAS